MSNSIFVCGHRGCGLPVTTHRSSWRHALGGRTGAIPAHRKHKAVPVYRTEYDRAFAPDTPLPEARALVQKFRSLDTAVNGG